MTINMFDDSPIDLGAYCVYFVALVRTTTWFGTESLTFIRSAKWKPAEPEALNRAGEWWLDTKNGDVYQIKLTREDGQHWGPANRVNNALCYLLNENCLTKSEMVQVPPRPEVPPEYALTGEVRPPKEGEQFIRVIDNRLATAPYDYLEHGRFRGRRWIVRFILDEVVYDKQGRPIIKFADLLECLRWLREDAKRNPVGTVAIFRHATI